MRGQRAVRWWWIGSLGALLLAPVGAHAAKKASKPVRPAPKAARSKAPSIRVVSHSVKTGETLTSILGGHELAPGVTLEWDAALRRTAGDYHLAPGHVLTLHFDGKTLVTLSYEVDDFIRVRVARDGKTLRGAREPLQAQVKMVAAEGVVTTSIAQAARQAKIPAAVVTKMADILAGEYDFRRIRPGDRFRILYEERRHGVDGRLLAPGKVLAAEIRSGTRVAQAFFYDDGGVGLYVDGNGRPVDQEFLRFPVEFARISSGFSNRRFHPILKTHRPHHGVDFAAPAGTPVRASADGVVVSAGRNGDYGNHVEVRHQGGWVTAYSHLQNIRAEVKVGQKVARGQVLGGVGRTGLATGAHLHFALFRKGQYMNPLTAKVDLRRTLRDPSRFAKAKEALLRQISQIVRPVPPLEAVVVADTAEVVRPAPRTITQ